MQKYSSTKIRNLINLIRNRKSKKHFISKQTMVQTILYLFGGILIFGSVAYLVSVFWQYHEGEAEYAALQEQVFAQASEEISEVSTDPNIKETIEETTDEIIEETTDELLKHKASYEDTFMKKDAVNVKTNQENTGYTVTDEQIMKAVGELKEQNKDTVGWIVFDNMDLSYPIMQGTDNDYYLTHTFSGETNSAGSIFMETENASDFEDYHTIIYGHNMRNLSMFGKLKKYKTEEDFYEEHQYFTIYTQDEVYRYQIFAYYDIPETDIIYTIGFLPDAEFKDFIDTMKRRSYYDTGVEVTEEDKIITLSTCSNEGNRFVINAKRMEE